MPQARACCKAPVRHGWGIIIGQPIKFQVSVERYSGTQIALDRLIAGLYRLGEWQRLWLERHLQGHAVQEADNHGGGMANVEAAKDTHVDALAEEAGHLPAELGVEHRIDCC